MTPKTRFHNLLEALIEQEIEKIKEELANGVVDNLRYWRCVGQIDGLRGSLRLCDDIERDLNERLSQ